MKKKILCIQLKQIGDVLMNTPAIRSLADNFPNAEIHFLTIPPAHQVFEFNPYIQKTYKYPKKERIQTVFNIIRQLRAERYTHVIDFHGIPKTALISWLTKATIRIGHRLKGRSLFYTDSVPAADHYPYSAQKKSFLLSALGIKTSNYQLSFFTNQDDDQKAEAILNALKVNPNRYLISVSPVSRRDYKVWPAIQFSNICDFLIEKYQAQILFLWGPGEYHFVEAVRKAMKYKDLGDYEMPTLRETVALLKNVTLHFGNDNGPMHFANAAGTPSIAIFGRPKMENWLEPDSLKHKGVEFDPGCKDNCFYPKCSLECLTSVDVDLVKNIIKESLSRLKDIS